MINLGLTCRGTIESVEDFNAYFAAIKNNEIPYEMKGFLPYTVYVGDPMHNFFLNNYSKLFALTQVLKAKRFPIHSKCVIEKFNELPKYIGQLLEEGFYRTKDGKAIYHSELKDIQRKLNELNTLIEPQKSLAEEDLIRINELRGSNEICKLEEILGMTHAVLSIQKWAQFNPDSRNMTYPID
ncbi:MAG: hypothetical protein PHE43_03760 [Candidatus Nanoarchaeia archaeon]|nr:hypothetical protein [Candidatus Nanoarchaeia archaeon]